jgi:hypothetical protein
MTGRGEADPAVPAAGEKRWSGRGKKKDHPFGVVLNL